MGNQASSIAKDLQSSTDSRYYVKSDVYNRNESDTRFATKDAVPTLDNMYTKSNVDQILNTRYFDRDTSDARFAKVGDAYLKAESDARFPVKDGVYTKTETDGLVSRGLAGVYDKEASNALFANKVTTEALLNGAYSKADIDKFLVEFRNSLGLPSESPFPTNTNISWALDQMARVNDVTNRGRDVKVTQNVESADACSALCNNTPNARIAVHRGSTRECFCKSGTSMPTSSTGTTSFVPNRLSQRGTWQQAVRLPEQLSYDVNADGLLMPQSDTCLTADTSGRVSWSDCLSAPSQIIRYTPSSGFLQSANGRCITMKSDQTGVTATDCPPPGQMNATNPSRWTWDQGGKLQSAMTAPTGGSKMCLGVPDPALVRSNSEVTTSACNTPGNLSWIPQNDYVMLNGIPDMTGIGYNTAPANSHRDCRARCSLDRGCDLYTHSEGLKSCTLGKLAQVARFTAGIKGHDNNMTYMAGRNMLGDALTSVTTTAASALDCGTQCTSSACQTMAFDSSATTNNCVLFPPSTSRTGTIGYKPLGVNNF